MTHPSFSVILSSHIGIFNSRKYDVNSQPNTQGIWPLVGRTSPYRRRVIHILAVILSKTCHFYFICQYISNRVTLSGREICPLLIYPSIFLKFQLTAKIRAQVRGQPFSSALELHSPVTRGEWLFALGELIVHVHSPVQESLIMNLFCTLQQCLWFGVNLSHLSDSVCYYLTLHQEI